MAYIVTPKSPKQPNLPYKKTYNFQKEVNIKYSVIINVSALVVWLGDKHWHYVVIQEINNQK